MPGDQTCIGLSQYPGNMVKELSHVLPKLTLVGGQPQLGLVGYSILRLLLGFITLLAKITHQDSRGSPWLR